MKPLPSRPPVSSRRSQGGGEGGDQEVGMEGGILSSARRSCGGEVERPFGVGVNPTWMRKLEDRYQKLHRKIASIPTCSTPASRFNFLTRKFLNETLAKAHKKQSGLSTNNSTYTTSNKKIPSTAPNATTYKESLDEDDLLPPPCEGDDSSSDSDSNIDDANDENLPPAGLPAPARALTADDGKRQYYPCDLHPHLHPASFTHPPRRVRGSSLGSVEGVPSQAQQQRSPLLERDGSVEGNANRAPGLLAQAGHLTHVTEQPSRSARSGQPQDTSRPEQVPVNSGVSVGQCGEQLTASADPLTDATGGDREDITNAWLDRHMVDRTASEVRTLNPISTAGSKRGAMFRATQTRSQYSYITTKSCPAILNSSRLPSSSRRHSGSQRPDTRERGSRHTTRVLPQMSVEARHAIVETLKEMGALTPKQQPQEKEEEEEEKEEKSEREDNTKKNNTNNLRNGLLSLPKSATSALPPQQQQQRYKPFHRTSTQGSGHYSQKTLPRQRSYGAIRPTETTSSVNATVKGGRSPGRAHKKPRSVNTSVNVRRSCKSAKTCPDEYSADIDRYLDGFDQLSMASAGNTSQGRSSPELRYGPPLRTNFPAITSRTEPEVIPGQNHLQQVSYKIHGVGSYRVPRERTFEITEPDFDIRYRDVITCQKGDRDTPPPDIFEKSVGKVRDWLNKYFFQS